MSITMFGAKRNRSLFRCDLLTLVIYIWIFALESVSTVDAIHSDKYLSSQGNYYIHFMSETEKERISVQKCCPNEKVLDREGNCVPLDSKPGQLEWEGIQLERRFSQAIKDNGVNGSEDDIEFSFRFTIGRPRCLTRLEQLSIHPSSKDSRFTKGLEFVTRDRDDNRNEDGDQFSFLIIDSRYYCIDWLPSLDTIAVQFCRPETCHSNTTKREAPLTTLDPYRETLSTSSSSSSALIPTLPSRPLCLRKCCPPSKAMNMTSFKCVQHDVTWQLHPLKPSRNYSRGEYDDDDDDPTSQTIPLAVTWLTGMPNCSYYEVYSDEYDSYYINSDGVLITVQNGAVGEDPPGEYCFEGVVLEDEEKPRISRQMAMVCFPDYGPTEGEAFEMETAAMLSWRLVYTILTGISCIFLLITCFIYGILWKDLNLPGWLQFAYAFSLLLTFTLLTVAQLWTQQIHDISKSLCSALGYLLHLSFLSSFFWLSSLNLDLFLSFRNTLLVRGFGKGRGKRRFLGFTAFSVGIPAAITLLLLAADNCSPDDTRSICILPSSGIGEESCVIDTRHKVAGLHYFYSFVGLLLLINLVIFVGTLISLRDRERETRLAKRQSTCNCDYDRLQLFTRLFLIMGVLWIFEVIAWICEYVYGTEKVYKIFIFTDSLNASQGIAVFLMFVWKKQTWKQLKKKIKSLVGMRGKRPLSRPSYTYTVSNGTGKRNETSVKSSHLSSTKSSDSSQIPSTSTTISQFEFDH